MVGVARYEVDLFDTSLVDDPFPTYEQIRTTGRVVWNEVLQGWMITGFDDCVAVAADGGGRFGVLGGDPDYALYEAANMVSTDGTEHTRLRKSLAPLFTRHAMMKWERRVREVVDELLQPLVEGSGAFSLSDFTKVPVILVAEMLGIPKERHDDFRRWSHSVISNLDVLALAANGELSPEGARRSEELWLAQHEMGAYLREEIDRHRRHELDDLITVMLHADMSDAEIVATGQLLMAAGYDTTAKTMGNCVVVLEQHPDQRRLIAEDLSRVAQAIEEVLRWAGANHVTMRRVMRDTELAGTELSRGQIVYVLYGAANRDPARWRDPQRFDVGRGMKSHLGFGFGPHLCIGAHLARLETRVALERLLQIAPQYGVREVDYGKALVVRGPERGFINVAVHINSA